jgi:pyruvate ferredoxin oxidoreductase alpha subunit
MRVLTGNAAVAFAVKQLKPDVVISCPVTPSSPILESIASFIAEGEMDAEFIHQESEYSAMSGCIGASAAGGRVFTATASRGLSMTQEALFQLSSLRLPVVVGVTNRAVSSPLNIFADHSDVMAQRDCGWVQIFSENPQEAYDNSVQAFKIAEHPDVRVPVMVNLDGFVTSHTMENVLVETDEEIDDFAERYHGDYSLLDTEQPITMGAVAMPDYYFEHKVHQELGLENSRKVIKDIGKEYGDRFGRYYGNFETYKLEDAEYGIVLIGSSAGTAKEVVDYLRSKNEKVGVLKLRVFRPFPFKEIREALGRLTAIAVLDRSISPGGYGGPLFTEIRSALFDLDKMPTVKPFVYGLGGRDINSKHIEEIFVGLKSFEDNGKKELEVSYINVRVE